MESEVISVDVILRLGNTTSAAAIKRAFRFYSSTYVDRSDPSISFEIKYKDVQDENHHRFTFLGTGTALDIADGVHRFMESFLEELYDETVEEDWLCELDCEDLPLIIDYDVESAKAYHEEEM